MAKLIDNVAPFEITEVAHAAHEFLAKRVIVRGSRSDVSDARGFARLLRLRRERPRGRRAAEQRDEFATFQLIEWHSTPAARARLQDIELTIVSQPTFRTSSISGRYRRGIVRDDGSRRTPPACGLPWCRFCAGHRRRNRFPMRSQSPRTPARD